MWFRGPRVSKGLKAHKVNLAHKVKPGPQGCEGLKAHRVNLAHKANLAHKVKSGPQGCEGLKAHREELAISTTWTMATGSVTLKILSSVTMEYHFFILM